MPDHLVAKEPGEVHDDIKHDDNSIAASVASHLSQILYRMDSIESKRLEQPTIYKQYKAYIKQFVELVHYSTEISEKLQHAQFSGSSSSNSSKSSSQHGYKETTIWIVEARWQGDLLCNEKIKPPIKQKFSRNPPARYQRNSHYPNQAIPIYPQLTPQQCRQVREFLRQCFSVYGEIQQDEPQQSIFGIDLPNHRIQTPTGVGRYFRVRFTYDGPEAIKRAKQEKILKLINDPHAFQEFPLPVDPMTGEERVVKFTHFERVGADFKKDKIQPSKTKSKKQLPRNRFLLFNVDKRLTGKAITNVIRKYSDISKLAKDMICEHLTDNSWFCETIIPLNPTEIKDIEKRLRANILPQSLETLDQDKIKDQLQLYKKINDLPVIQDKLPTIEFDADCYKVDFYQRSPVRLMMTLNTTTTR